MIMPLCLTVSPSSRPRKPGLENALSKKKAPLCREALAELTFENPITLYLQNVYFECLLINLTHNYKFCSDKQDKIPQL